MMIHIYITNINLQASKQKYTHILDTPALSLTKNKKTKTKQNKKKLIVFKSQRHNLKKQIHMCTDIHTQPHFP